MYTPHLQAYFEAANKGSAAGAAGSSIVAEVTDKAEFLSTVGSSGLTVVDYWAPWCRNCKKISPVVDRLVGELPHVKFIKVNTIEAEEIAVQFGVDALPTFQFFKNGQKVGEFKGSDAAAVEAAIKSYA
jgi:thioredoxin 1